MTQRARDVFETYFRRLYGDRDLRVIDEMRAPGAGTKGLSNTQASYRQLVARILEVLPHTEITLERVVESGDEAALFMRFRGRTHDDRPIEMKGAGFLRFVDGKIDQVENLWDVAGLLASLGDTKSTAATLADAVEHIASVHGASPRSRA
ncbi:MAG: nuclear transport factor 2 family protein [Deltaproteobacteria bacterium]|nr:nuclear transport factor 2 family protein [Deltaproteobacteria bacterium]